ncbi:MAG TPA: histidine phosphatase family protein [Nocardioides sp.]|nr:histidine phosphatase family protein [Nocardioides sp.]
MVVRTLVVLRHAKSDWSTGQPDRDRPLAPRGRRQAPEAGAWLAANLDLPGLAVVSPAQRTRATWELVSAALPDDVPVRIEERVYAATGRELAEVVASLPPEVGSVVLVGHNPGVEDLVQDLSGEWVPMKTSALAVLTWEGAWTDAGSARLVAHGRPPG